LVLCGFSHLSLGRGAAKLLVWVCILSDKKEAFDPPSWCDFFTKKTHTKDGHRMDQKTSLYVPACLRSFQGFNTIDIKEFIADQEMILVLEKSVDRVHLCGCCGAKQGAYHSQYKVTARHMRMMGWFVSVQFFREKRWCKTCRGNTSEFIDFLCPTSTHITLELAWWINRLSEISSVLQVSELESVDKMACYKVDHHILTRLLQGYKIPGVKRISVDEVYARGPKQQKIGETRDDLFVTVIVDQRTHKVIWVSQSRRKEALDAFFELIGPEACKEIEVVATDQHEGYAASVRQYCPSAALVWDRFHLVQKFNEALNEERKKELANIDPEGQMGDLMNGKYRYVFLTKAGNRGKLDKKHIDQVMKLNERMAKLELIKEHFHKMYNAPDVATAQVIFSECYEWSMQINANFIVDWIRGVFDEQRFWNFWIYRLTTGVSEGINRAIKGLKWQAYGYKNMAYFALKILQKCGYLNHRFYLAAIAH
jgi:transposase